ncbi:MAG TPA: hypothetical protein P5137_01715 [Candidatus Brocadiia bacterium]|nr:hypothetical protein [Candidatus Brocadiia bacterium]
MARLEAQRLGTDMDRFQRLALAGDARKLTERIADVEKLLDACAPPFRRRIAPDHS